MYMYTIKTEHFVNKISQCVNHLKSTWVEKYGSITAGLGHDCHDFTQLRSQATRWSGLALIYSQSVFKEGVVRVVIPQNCMMDATEMRIPLHRTQTIPKTRTHYLHTMEPANCTPVSLRNDKAGGLSSVSALAAGSWAYSCREGDFDRMKSSLHF